MVTTKDKILELRQQDPEIKAVRMAEQLNITREAVRQTLVKLDMPTNFWKPYARCLDCGELLSHNNHLAKRCRSCWSKSHHTTLTCEICGKTHEIKLCEAKLRLKRYKHHFCGRRCRGKWLGVNYGFKRKEANNNACIMVKENG